MKRTRSTRYALLPAIIVLVLCAIGYSVYASHSFRAQYKAFTDAEDTYETAAYKPAVGDNPVRQTIGYLLSQVIQVEMSASQRLENAKRGIAQVKALEEQVDDIKTQGDAVTPLLDRLDASSHSIALITKRGELTRLVTLARRQAKIIADIRGLSYSANYYTREVFERVIDDQGEMTDEHKRHLNELIPQLESQFDQRTNLYTELTENKKTMDDIAAGLGIR